MICCVCGEEILGNDWSYYRGPNPVHHACAVRGTLVVPRERKVRFSNLPRAPKDEWLSEDEIMAVLARCREPMVMELKGKFTFWEDK